MGSIGISLFSLALGVAMQWASPFSFNDQALPMRGPTTRQSPTRLEKILAQPSPTTQRVGALSVRSDTPEGVLELLRDAQTKAEQRRIAATSKVEQLSDQLEEQRNVLPRRNGSDRDRQRSLAILASDLALAKEQLELARRGLDVRAPPVQLHMLVDPTIGAVFSLDADAEGVVPATRAARRLLERGIDLSQFAPIRGADVGGIEKHFEHGYRVELLIRSRYGDVPEPLRDNAERAARDVLRDGLPFRDEETVIVKRWVWVRFAFEAAGDEALDTYLLRDRLMRSKFILADLPNPEFHEDFQHPTLIRFNPALWIQDEADGTERSPEGATTTKP